MSHHHHHQHHHHRHHHDGQTHGQQELGQLNKNHFDNIAATIWDTPWIQEVAKQITNELQENIAWINIPHSGQRETKILDYACGNGVASRALAPYVTRTIGLDISPEMVKQFNTTAEKEGYPATQMRAVVGDLLDPASADLNSPDLKDFDLTVISMALHHVEEPSLMIAKLAETLREGGVLLVVDWVEASESGCERIEVPEDQPVRHTVSRTGFKEAEVREAFEEAGLGEWGWKWFSKRSQMPLEKGGESQLFIARGVKGAARSGVPV